MGDEIWQTLAGALAEQEDTVRKILKDHRADPDSGRCVSCTVAGRGIPGTRHPCGPYSLAIAALRIIERRQ